mmetsp:Transcript_28435/g.47770  ORF Transcript_28435/g.47770 Transcript_28435/m.47770 type:complete len:737 (-) Transcript_28435:794-3004(-)|eukprot:CAMPEP_0174974482 /NCGR_PEP_ID=MMETSP0004_2-20121128/11869_1 /TAXON_ID=420556 /ORGANISM="Ochromonas sp., Strain CCMP1393" /LENGTH=736 /DNA_ID=CAMNT_0016225141 /DNA_START=14 /DNA_END=2224 /DNA_ORIENTATION=-
MAANKLTAWYVQPKFLFLVFSFANLLLFIDRGIIPGATNEFNAFIKSNVETSTPDVFLGLLQSAFIVGLAIGSAIFGHMIHHYGRFFLTGIGCFIWTIAVVMSGLSRYADSYTFLILARMLSGVGEASLQVSIPPWIQQTAPKKETGMWLAIFYTAVPVGTALGYAYSSLMAEAFGWEWAYFVEGMIMFPLVVFTFFISPYFPLEHDAHHHSSADSIAVNGESISGRKTSFIDTMEASDKLQIHKDRSPMAKRTTKATAGSSNSSRNNSKDSPAVSAGLDLGLEEEGGGAHGRLNSTASEGSWRMHSVSSTGGSEDSSPVDNNRRRTKPPTFVEEFGIVLSKPLFLCLVAAYAAQTAMLIGLSTFGSALLMGIGYFNSESESSTTFGGLICISGVISTPLGGLVLDRMTKQAKQKARPQLLLQEQQREQQQQQARAGTGAGTGAGNDGENGGDASVAGPLYSQQSIERDVNICTSSSDDGAEEGQQTGTSSNRRASHSSVVSAGQLEEEFAAYDDSDFVKRLKMDTLLKINIWSSVIGAALLIVVYWTPNEFTFLAFVTIGVGFMFFCTPAINLGFMLSVPKANQSFALAMMVVFMHALGDVPSPVIVGLIKDKLAPGCIADEDDDGEGAATSDECRDDAPGLRLTILLVNLWLIWCVVFFALAWYLNHFHRQWVDNCTYCQPATDAQPPGICCAASVCPGHEGGEASPAAYWARKRRDEEEENTHKERLLGNVTE